MNTQSHTGVQAARRAHRFAVWAFGTQLLMVILACVLGIAGVLSNQAMIAAILLVSVSLAVTCYFARKQWRPVRAMARLVERWNGRTVADADADARRLADLSRHEDADIAALARGLQGFVTRIVAYNQRERNFTRDASHELRSPLTVIKMSVDMLAEEQGISEFGLRSVGRIKRATLEMEALVETLLILAREPCEMLDEEYFVVNDVLHQQLEAARELLDGRPIDLELQDAAQFALRGSSRALSVLCWQLIRNAGQQMEQGRIVICVRPGMIRVSNRVEQASHDNGVQREGADRHGFELAIAQRICERFGWPLELQSLGNGVPENIAIIHFPKAEAVQDRGRGNAGP